MAPFNQYTFYAGSTLAFWFRGDNHILLESILKVTILSYRVIDITLSIRMLRQKFKIMYFSKQTVSNVLFVGSFYKKATVSQLISLLSCHTFQMPKWYMYCVLRDLKSDISLSLNTMVVWESATTVKNTAKILPNKNFLRRCIRLACKCECKWCTMWGVNVNVNNVIKFSALNKD